MSDVPSCPVDQAVAAFCSDVRLSGRTTSARNYAYTLKPLASLVATVDQLDQAAARQLLEARARALGPAALRSFFFTLRAFCRWSVAHDLLQADPTAGLPVPADARPAHRWLGRDQLRRLYAACDDDAERLALLLLGGCGLRCQELLGLRLVDVDFAAGVVRVFGKGRKHRQVAPGALALRLLELRRRDGCTYVVPFRHQTSLSWRLKRLARRAGLDPHDVAPHLLRHSFAVHFLEASDEDGLSLQQLLGHSSPAMTQHYVRSVRAAAAVRKQQRVDLAGRLFG